MHRAFDMTIPTIRLAIAALAASVACATVPAGGNVTPLEGPQWRLALLDGSPARSASATRAPYIRFVAEGNRAEGTGGCNRMSGAFRRNEDQLSFGPMASTKMACADNDLNAQEQQFMAALGDTRRFTITSDTLRLIDAASTVRALLVVQR